MVLIGRLKLSYQDLFIYTLNDLALILEGHEVDKRDDWERTRSAAVVSIMPHVKKGSKVTGPSIMPLPWDKIENSDKLVERAKEKIAKLKERNGRIRN
jgi:hypothetical protein